MTATRDGGPIVELERVSVRFETGDGVALMPLREVSLAVTRGTSLAIVGPSGSGKTTLLQVMGGLTPPTSGVARIDGEDLSGLGDAALARLRNEKVGFVFQMHHLLPQCTVLENVLMPTLVAARRDPQADRARAESLLDQVGLADRQRHRPSQLSGGECQRVAVARALINEPPLLLADEPTGALDQATASHLADQLLDLTRRRGVTLVTVTHWTPLADRMDQTLELRGGALHPREGDR